MLTLRSAEYTPEELTLLREIMTNAHIETVETLHCDGCCESCKGRHVCGDIARLIAFIEARKACDAKKS